MRQKPPKSIPVIGNTIQHMFQSLKTKPPIKKRAVAIGQMTPATAPMTLFLSYPFRTVLVNFHQFFISFSGTGACYKNKYCGGYH